MVLWKNVQRPMVTLSLVAVLATGCSKQQAAIDAAKKDVATTGQPEEVIYVDHAGNTTMTMVSAAAPGTTLPTITQSVSPAGATSTGLPDWSNGQHPPANYAARYNAPGVLAAPVMTSAPGAATVASAPVAYAPGVAQPVNGDAPYTNAAPANFVPTNVTIASGTGLAIRINQRIDVKHTTPGTHFTGELAESVTRDGNVLLPRGTHVRGVVDASHRRGHFKGRSILELRLTSLDLNGHSYDLETADFVASKKGKGKRSAGFIAGTTGVGMLVGGIASGGLGLGVGALAGGGLGTLLAGATGNRDIVIPAESLVRFRLEDDLTVQPSTTTSYANQDVPVNVAQR
jgi:hypothetical protein